jgi:ABC-type sugar transport system ATPase subunit
MIEFVDICKSFMGNPALTDVSFKVYPGEILALLGQNGAGKSTLMKILSGVYQKDSGQILIEDKKVEIASPIDAEEQGIGIVYQELSGVGHLSVSENIVLGNDPCRKLFLDKKAEAEIARKNLDRLGVTDLNLKVKLNALNVSQQQICEIAKCMSKNPKIVVFDEPTTALAKHEREKLFEIMRKMRDDGLTIIFVTHYLEEVLDLADKALILKDGKIAYYGSMEGMNEGKLVKYMIGQSMENFFPEYHNTQRYQVALELKGFGGGIVAPTNLKVHYGEVVGLSGLIGSGRTELAHMIIGEEKPAYGHIAIDGKPVKINHPNTALKNGIAYINEDRRTGGLNLSLPISFNLVLPVIVAGKREISKGPFVRTKTVQSVSNEMVDKLEIKCSSTKQRVINLSGGNQQKVSIGKWIASQAKIFIFDEPTKGIDVKAKAKVYEVIRELAAEGCAVIMISSYNPELMGVCDRIEVMAQGKMVGSFERDVTEELLMLAQQA